jgi:glycosyltransferase involved in cell wall biosynthesis
MKQPLVSVIIPNYNYGRFLSDAIDSVLAQSYSNIEIIVVDDGSTDNSHEVYEKYFDKIGVINQKNLGVGAARNAGASYSQGQFIAFLDADDIWLADKISSQVEEFATNEEIGLVNCGMIEFGGTNEKLGEYTEGKSGWCAENLLKHEPVVVGPGSTLLIRTELYKELNGFDERKELHGAEDWEFCYRVAERSQIKFLPEVLVKYRNHGGNTHLKIAKMERALFLAYEKVFMRVDPEVQTLKDFCYGKIHMVLAGSYFYAGQYPQSLRHCLKALWFYPRSASQIFGFPVRLLKRYLNPGSVRNHSS